MRAGDVIGGRWRLLAEAPADGSVRRWRAIAIDTGEPSELLSLRPGVSAEGRRSFVAAHTQLRHAADPALNPTLEVLSTEAGPVVVRAPLEDPTLAGINGALEPEQVAAVGARLLPAVLAAGGATGGALQPGDVGIDPTGRPVLAPLARPLSHVDRAVQAAVAPECFEGAVPDGASGLYGLGMLLYALATGRAPQRPTIQGRRAPPPPPSVIRPALPDALDRAILTLLSEVPGQRAGAMPLLLGLAADPEQTVDLREALSHDVPPAPQSPAPRPQIRAPELPTAAARVVLPAAALERLDPAGRSAAAGFAGLPLSVVETLSAEGLPLVLASSQSSTVARQQARDLAARAGLPVVAARSNHFATFALALIVACFSVGAALTGALLAWFFQLSVVFWGTVAGSASLLAGGVSWGRVRAQGALHAASVKGHRRAIELRQALDPEGRLARTWSHLSEVRKALAVADLPAAAGSDLRGALRDLERRLEAMAGIERTAHHALAGLDHGRLKTRLAALERRAATDPAARAERDQLTRTLLDYEAVVERRDALAEEARRIDATLDEVATALGRLAEREDREAEALKDLVRTTAAVSAALAEPLGAASPRGPSRAIEDP